MKFFGIKDNLNQYLEGVVRGKVTNAIESFSKDLSERMQQAAVRHTHAYYNDIRDRVLREFTNELNDAINEAISKTKIEITKDGLNFEIKGSMATLRNE